jgi:hypothetical protein
MFGSTYAVMWQSPDGTRCSGRLDLDRDVMTLNGGRNGCKVCESIPLQEIENVQVKSGRLNITLRNALPLVISSLDAPGVLRELAERLATLC